MKATELQVGDIVRRAKVSRGTYSTTGTVLRIYPEGLNAYRRKPAVYVEWLHRHAAFATGADRTRKSFISPANLLLVERQPATAEDNLELARGIQAWARRCSQD